MSDNSQTAQIVGEYSSLQTQAYVDTAILCLLAYEFVITLESETKLFWKQRITGSSILFFVNRYLSLVSASLGMPIPDPTTTKGCAAAYYIMSSVEYLQYLPWALFSTLRAYALSLAGSCAAGQWSLSILVLLSSLAPVITNFVAMGYWSIVGTSDGCDLSLNLSAAIQIHVTIVSRVCLITSDLIVMYITWKATYKSRDTQFLGQGSSLSSILFKNGTLYFGILATLNVLHLSFTLSSTFGAQSTTSKDIFSSNIIIFSEPLTAILVSRFLMDLQEANNAVTHSQLSSMSSLDFNRVIGSLGSLLPASGETSEVQSVLQDNDGEMEMERADNPGVGIPDGAP